MRIKTYIFMHRRRKVCNIAGDGGGGVGVQNIVGGGGGGQVGVGMGGGSQTFR